MDILITNDDGIDAEGIKALTRFLVTTGHNLYLVAPSQCRSAGSMSLTLGKPMALSEQSIEGVRKAFSLEGTSVDCVKLALTSLDMPPFDLVISGINLGLNVARDLHYSATVGAAVEATLSHIPAIAVSAECDEDNRCRLHDACDILRQEFQHIYTKLRATKPQSFANINVPLQPFSEICITKAASDLVYCDCYRHDSTGYELIGPRNIQLRDHAFDLGAINDGCASISYLTPSWN